MKASSANGTWASSKPPLLRFLDECHEKFAADDEGTVADYIPELSKADRKGANLLEHLRPGPSLPDAEILVAHGWTRPQRRSIVQKKLGQRI